MSKFIVYEYAAGKSVRIGRSTREMTLAIDVASGGIAPRKVVKYAADLPTDGVSIWVKGKGFRNMDSLSEGEKDCAEDIISNN
jgi:hypothetical protein